MFGLGMQELIIILVIVIVLFWSKEVAGTRRTVLEKP